MHIGFDFGTANCSVATMVGDVVQRVALFEQQSYMASALVAPNRESVSEYLFRHRGISPTTPAGQRLLARAIAFNKEEDLPIGPDDVDFGLRAFEQYLQDPQEVYYVKSPKSFLGAMGLGELQLAFFEDLVCALMDKIKTQAEQSLKSDIKQVVIGRPINFQGRGGEESNRQAESILRQAATRVGFQHIEFQYEPVAAGLEYEANLEQDQIVLVVDIGGGTTDCSLLKMGPSWRHLNDRQACLLAHSGQRIGGNDLDIQLAFKQLMPTFGYKSLMESGLEMPNTQFWNPIAINDISAQKRFYARENEKDLKALIKQAQSPEKLKRLLAVHRDTLGYQLVKCAEQAKIALSAQSDTALECTVNGESLNVAVTQQNAFSALQTPIQKMVQLVDEVRLQAQHKPDVVFITGGSARSPFVRQAIEKALPGVPLVSGDDLGSVTSGLARWAKHCFE
ncbi:MULTISPECIES: molecular chaperone [unclassified Vibrio]|uniref:Molecular chaperone n=1 Tax=Vibrio sp. HB236076 TaxID=3232307 RepID=A0AB39HA57_9VIBR|nr:molecular chaperone [Vibrio sp. HB161653]MDP5253773.1 molecular chaperone [Vibrio sp. HB161653]